MARHVKKSVPAEETLPEQAAERVDETVETAEETIEEKTAETAVENIEENAGEGDPEEPAKPVVNEGNEPRRQPAPPKKDGFSPVLLIALLVIAVGLGVLGGYLLSRRNAPPAEEAPQDIGIGEADVGEIAWEDEEPFAEELDASQIEALTDLAGLSEGVEWDELSELDALSDFEFGEGEEAVDMPAEAVVVAEFDGGTIMSDEAVDAYSEAITTAAFLGGDPDEITMESVLHDMVGARLQSMHAAALKDQLTAEEKTALHEEAEQSFNDLAEMIAGELADGTDADAEAMLTEAKNELTDGGITAESLEAELIDAELIDRMMADVIAEVNVGDEDVRKAYDEQLAAQKADFDAVPDDFEWASLNGDTIVYNLPGYRAVQIISIYLSDADSEDAVAELSEIIAEGGEDAEEAQAELNALYDEIESMAQACKEELSAEDADFESILLQYGEDEGMTDPDMRERGYYIGKNSVVWGDEISDAVMALEKVGDTTDVLRTVDGVVIMRYIGDVTPGEVPFEDVRGAFETEALEAAQEAAQQKQVESWIEEAHVKYYPERMQ